MRAVRLFVLPVLVVSVLLGCGGDSGGNGNQQAGQKIQQMNAILMSMNEMGVALEGNTGGAFTINKNLNLKDYEVLQSQLEELILLGQQVMAIDKRSGGHVNDIEQVQLVVEKAQMTLITVRNRVAVLRAPLL